MKKDRSANKANVVLSPGRIAWKKLLHRPLALAGAVVLILMVIAVIFAPQLATHGRDDIDMFATEQAPGKGHLLGTDEIGRDVFTRLLYGGQVSLGVGFAAVILQVLIGVTLGAIAGYFGGWVDACIMRLIDIVMCFPFYVIAISMAALLGPSAWNVVPIIGVLSWPGVARIVRGQMLSMRTREFIEASRCLGLTSREIIVKHLLPNTLSPIIVYATLGMANAILTEAGLSFLGMGVNPPQPSWGNMLSRASNAVAAINFWWQWVFTSAILILTTVCINTIGDTLRDVMDPKSTNDK